MNKLVNRLSLWRAKKDNRGFSLVELIIVIAIMAVLTAVLAPQLLKYVERAREARDRQNILAMKRVFDLACADYGSTVIEIVGNGGFKYNANGNVHSINATLVSILVEAFGPNTATAASTYKLPPLTSRAFKDGAQFYFRLLDKDGNITNMTSGNKGGMMILEYTGTVPLT